MNSTDAPRITFGIIVLNGEPFTKYTLRALYPYAHQLIVVEGAARAARNIAQPDGHSNDGTLERLREFKAEEDPDAKLTIVTAEDEGHPDGFWPGEKDEQSRAYANRADGDFLWQVDIDEFYLDADVERILTMLRTDPTLTGMSFKQITFWGGLDYVVDGWYLRRGATYYHRLFRWRPGYTYTTHRPPTVLDEEGRDLRRLHWVSGESLARQGIRLYHYSLLFPKQVIEKCDYYSNAEWADRSGALAWANDSYMTLGRPYRVHNVYRYPSWLERYDGSHPAQVRLMMSDVKSGVIDQPLRDNHDVVDVLGSRRYRAGRALLKSAEPFDRTARGIGRPIKRILERT